MAIMAARAIDSIFSCDLLGAIAATGNAATRRLRHCYNALGYENLDLAASLRVPTIAFYLISRG